MNRKADEKINRIMFEILGLIIFGFVALVWFGGIESIISGSTDNFAVKNFNNFLAPIASVCGNDVINASATAIGLDISVYGKTYIVTQLTIPQIFTESPTSNIDLGMLPAQMYRCIDATCLCLLELKEHEGNWQMCTAAEWDLASVAVGFAPGCPFWYYAPPDLIEQAITDLWGITNLAEEIGVNLAFQFFGEALGLESDRNYFTYPAPEVWGGCKGTDSSNIHLSTFTGSVVEKDCTNAGRLFKFKVNPISLINSVSTAINSNEPSDVVEVINETIHDLWTSKSTNLINQFISSAINNPLSDLSNGMSAVTEPLISGSYTDFLADSYFISSLSDSLVNYLGVPTGDLSLMTNLIIGNFTQTSDRVINSGEVVSNLNGAPASSTVLTEAASESIIFPLESHPSIIDHGLVSVYVKDNSVVEDLPALSVTINGRCLKTIRVGSTDYELLTVDFDADCFDYGDNTLSLSESHALSGYEIILGCLAGGNPLFEVEIIDLDEGFEKLVEAGLTNVGSAVYGLLVPEDFSPEQFFEPGSDYLTETKLNLKNNLTSTYASYIASIAEQSIFNSTDCTQLINPKNDLFRIRNGYFNLFADNFTKGFINGLSDLSVITDDFNYNAVKSLSNWGVVLDNYEDRLYTNTTIFTLTTEKDDDEDIEEADYLIEFTPPADFTITPNSESFTALPGSSRLYELKLTPLTPGVYEINYNLYRDYGSGNELVDGGFFDYFITDRDSPPSPDQVVPAIESIINQFSELMAEKHLPYAISALIDSGIVDLSAVSSTDFGSFTESLISNYTKHFKRSLINNSYSDLVSSQQVVVANYFDTDAKTSAYGASLETELSFVNNYFTAFEPYEIVFEVPVVNTGDIKTYVIFLSSPDFTGTLSPSPSELTLGGATTSGEFTVTISDPDSVGSFSLNYLVKEMVIEGGGYVYQEPPVIDGVYDFTISSKAYSAGRLIAGELYSGAGFTNYNTINNLAHASIAATVNRAVSELFYSAFEAGSSEPIPCWRGPDNYNDGVETMYFDGYPSINDLLGWNRFTSVARILPELLFIGISSTTDWLYNKISDAVTARIEGNRFTPTPLEERLDPIQTQYESEALDNYAFFMEPSLFMAYLFPKPVINITPSGNFSTGITGAISVTDVLGPLVKEAGEQTIKQLIKSWIISFFKKTVMFVVNMALFTVVSSVIGLANKEETIYSDGAIRTFDENKINVVSCVRLDDLGCDTNEILWVNETMECYTEVKVREAGNLETWIGMAAAVIGIDLPLFEQDKCLTLEPFEQCANPSVCYANSMTACFSMTCNETLPEDQIRVFQYWVGANGNPAGLAGPYNPRIPFLTVTRDDSDRVVLQAGPVGGGVPAID